MRDEQVGETELLLQIEQHVQDLDLDRDVERRNRLVGDDELGIHRQRAGNADALALSARELVRISPIVFRTQADPRQQFHDPLLAIAALGEAVNAQALRR